MWPFKSTHKHIGWDTLSEYLDGRLQGRNLERVEVHLGECGQCRLELEELQATVTLMRQLPMETPRRSFVMSAPPPEPARARPALALRAPNWVYAGAASVAALALAVTISVDATGGLSSDPLRQDVAVTALAPAPTSAQITSIPESASGLAARTETYETDDAGATPETLAAAAPIPSTTGPTSPEETAAGGAAAPDTGVPPLATTDAPVVSSAEPVQDSAVPAAEPTSPDSETSVVESASPESEAPIIESASESTGPASAVSESASTTAVPDYGQTLEPRTTTGTRDTSAESRAAKALPVEEPTPFPEQSEPTVIERDGESGTPVWWRVLEAVTGALAVAFLAGLVLRWRANRPGIR